MKNLALFQDLGLSQQLNKAVSKMGFEEATPIQAETIPLALEGKDLIGQAQTGTGKTTAFGVPMIEKLIKVRILFKGLLLRQRVNWPYKYQKNFTKLVKAKARKSAINLWWTRYQSPNPCVKKTLLILLLGHLDVYLTILTVKHFALIMFKRLF